MFLIRVTGQMNSGQRCVSAMKPQTNLHVLRSFSMTIFCFVHFSPVRAILLKYELCCCLQGDNLPLNLNGSKLSSAHKFCLDN